MFFKILTAIKETAKVIFLLPLMISALISTINKVKEFIKKW
jgi:hypothetical protein